MDPRYLGPRQWITDVERPHARLVYPQGAVYRRRLPPSAPSSGAGRSKDRRDAPTTHATPRRPQLSFAPTILLVAEVRAVSAVGRFVNPLNPLNPTPSYQLTMSQVLETDCGRRARLPRTPPPTASRPECRKFKWRTTVTRSSVLGFRSHPVLSPTLLGEMAKVQGEGGHCSRLWYATD